MNTTNIINIIIEYHNTRDDSQISKYITISDKTTLTSACIELLSWLRLEKKRELWISEGRKTSLKPLELNKSFPWCILLGDMITKIPDLNMLFEIKNQKLNFKESVPEITRSEIRTNVYTQFIPVRFE